MFERLSELSHEAWRPVLHWHLALASFAEPRPAEPRPGSGLALTHVKLMGEGLFSRWMSSLCRDR